ncbi:MAG: fimbrillin family protein [Candidatus Cryptobacteroides sp.]
MKPTLSLTAIAVVIAMAGCDKIGNSTPEEKPVPIRITSTVSKVASDQFELNDAIGIYVVNAEENAGGTWNPGTLKVSGNHLDNVKYTYSGTWEPEQEYYWKDSRTKADFYCYYPYISSAPADISAVPFTVPSDQSTIEAFKSGEILWGRTSLASPSENAVNIMTSHRTSQLTIEVVPGKGFTEATLKESITSLKINNIRCNATLNLNDGTLSATGSMSDVIPYCEGMRWSALIVPQKIESLALVTLVVDGVERSLIQTVEFSSNSRKKCTITVNKISEGINVGIGGWEEDDNDYGGTLN